MSRRYKGQFCRYNPQNPFLAPHDNMNDPAPELQPSVSQIVADALRSAADGLSRWLEHPIQTKQLSAALVDLDAAKASFAKPNDILCCCSMPIELAGSPENLADLCEPRSSESASVPAGRLLLAWDLGDAMWLIDRSLNETGTSEDQSTWGSLQWSAIAETSNVVGCEFLNAIAKGIQEISKTELLLIPDPPRITQQTADSLIDNAITDIEPSSNGSVDRKIWMATGTFQVADHSIQTRMAMVWCPRVWQRMTTLVNGSSNGGNG
jgi:hypothetical protein